MQPSIAIINAFDEQSYFIQQLSLAYADALKDAGPMATMLDVSKMSFKTNVDARKFSYETLEPDLQKCVDVITEAKALVVFISWKPGLEAATNGESFIKRLFHSDSGHINYNIWGHFQSDDKRVRVITVIEDEQASAEYKESRDTSMLPVYKSDIRLSGFGKIASKVFGYLIDNNMESLFAQKSVEKVKALAAMDAGYEMGR